MMLTRNLQQITPAPNRQLVPAATAKQAAAALSGLDDPDVDKKLAIASDAIASFCDVKSVDGAPPTFARQQVVENIVIPSDSRRFQLKRLSVSLRPCSLISISIDGVAFDVDELDGVFVESARGILSFKPISSRKHWAPATLISITYFAGYWTPSQDSAGSPPAEDPLPPEMPLDLERAAILSAQQIYASESRTDFDVAGTKEEDSDVGMIEKRYFSPDKIGGALPNEVISLLEPHRRLY